MTEPRSPDAFDVVVLGAGYAGMMAALRLHGRRQGPKRIALVNESDAFVERVRLQEGILATVGLRIPSIKRMMAGANIEFIQARVEALDADARQVRVVSADGARTLNFERAVVALGSHIDVSRATGVAEHAYRLDPGDGSRSVAALRKALHRTGDRRPVRVVVVGGAETGVEVAGEIKTQWPAMTVTMICQTRCCDFKGPRVERAIRAVLEGLGVELRDGAEVREVRADAVVLSDGQTIGCDLCVWSGGLAGSPIGQASGLTVDGAARIRVDPCLRSVTHPHIFVVGDAAHPIAPTGAPYRMSAFVALNTGAYVGDVILADLAGRKSRPFAFSTYGQGVAIGRVGVGFTTYPDDKAILPLVTGRTGIDVRNFFVWLVVQFLKIERRFPGFYFIAGRRRVSWARAEAAMRQASASVGSGDEPRLFKEASGTRVFRYHPLLVALHWLLAFLIIAALALGALVMVKIPNDSPMKLEALRSHMSGGVLILVLMLIRLVVRTRTTHPAAAVTGNLMLNRVAWASHRMFYGAVLVMAGSGIFMALQTHLPTIVFQGHGALPASFWVYPVRTVHFVASRVLMALIALHIAGAFYHTLVLKDGLLRRMFFGRRAAPAAGAASAPGQPLARVWP